MRLADKNIAIAKEEAVRLWTENPEWSYKKAIEEARKERESYERRNGRL